MALKPLDVQNPERDLELENRAPRGAERVAADVERVKKGGPSAEAELQALRMRLAAAKGANPQTQDDAPHCSDCFRRGFEAAVRMVEGAEG